MNNKVFLNEILDISYNPENYLKNDMLNLLYEYIEDVNTLNENDKKNKLKDLEEEIKFYREKNNLCQKCGHKLIITESTDNENLEYFGKLCRQPVSIRKCSYCNYIDDE